MAVIAQEICDEAARTLFDDGTRWPEAELFGYLKDAQRDIVVMKPAANTVNELVQLVAGTRQALPDGGISLVDVGGNYGLDGATPGRGVTQIARKELETFKPQWRADAPSVEAKHFIYDDRDPAHFELWPPQPDPAGYVELSYSATPAVIANIADPITLPDIYKSPLYYLVLAKAYSKTSGTQDFAKANTYEQKAIAMVNGRKMAKQELHPEQLQERTKR